MNPKLVGRWTIRAALSDDLLAVVDPSGRGDLLARAWSRKRWACEVCHVAHKSGAPVWRPLGNGNHRMERICLACVAGALSAV